MGWYGCRMWFIQNLSTQFLLIIPFFFSFKSLYVVDRGYFEYVGAQGVYARMSEINFFLNLMSFKSVLVILGFVLLVIVRFLFL